MCKAFCILNLRKDGILEVYSMATRQKIAQYFRAEWYWVKTRHMLSFQQREVVDLWASNLLEWSH